MNDELISRRAAIDIVIKGSTELGEDYSPKWVRKDLESLPIVDAVPVIRCKDCVFGSPALEEKNGFIVIDCLMLSHTAMPTDGYYDGTVIGIKDCCPLVEIRGRAQGHEFDYQFCAYAERRTDE